MSIPLVDEINQCEMLDVVCQDIVVKQIERHLPLNPGQWISRYSLP